MPNLPGKGLFARADGAGVGAGTEPISLSGTVPGSTTPQSAIEVWAGDSTNTPQLVWASTADPVTSVVATYSAPGGASQVVVTWTVHAAPAKADSYLVKRPDGSVAGTATGQTTATFTDTDPRALTGSYTVTAQLGSVSSAPVSSNSLSLNAAPTSVVATWSSTTQQVDVSWGLPAYGQPDQFGIWINGSYLGPVSGAARSWPHSHPSTPGVTNTYGVTAILSGTHSAIATDTEAIPSAVPTGIGSSGNFSVTFGTPPYGTPDHYDVFINGGYLGPIPGSSTSWASSTSQGNQITVTIRSQYVGGAYGDANVVISVPAADMRAAAGNSLAINRDPFGAYIQMDGFAGPTTGMPGVVSYYEVQRYPTAVGAWQAAVAGLPDIYNPSIPGYSMWEISGQLQFAWVPYSAAAEYGRVRAVGPGGAGNWLQLGPV